MIEEAPDKNSNTENVQKKRESKKPREAKDFWTPEEDAQLRAYVKKYGAKKWTCAQMYVPSKKGKQCRERWHNHLNNMITKAKWSIDEEWVLFILHKWMGNKWSDLSKNLPARSDNNIKNYWNSKMQKKVHYYTEELARQVRESLTKLVHDDLPD